MISPDSREWQENFTAYGQQLRKQIKDLLAQHQQRLDWSSTRLRHPGSKLLEHRQRLVELAARMRTAWEHQLQHSRNDEKLMRARLFQQSPRTRLRELQQSAGNLYLQLQRAMFQQLKQQRQQLNSSAQLLDTVSPLATLARGYTISTDDQGRLIRRTEDIQPGQSMTTRLRHGSIRSLVQATDAAEE
jgi:exodeoxyribonuclease VII large subunit